MYFRIEINNYLNYSWYNPITNEKINEPNKIIPLNNKLFTGDILNEKLEIIESPIRQNNICGILLILGKTYGRSKKGNKFYYKCIPDNKHLPAFLVSYEDKNVGFSKNKMNLYIEFKYVEWIDKHPVGMIINNFGSVNKLDSYYEYRLHSKNLAISIKECTNKVREIIRNSNIDYTNKTIENRQKEKVITIDPIGSKDYDDGISLIDNRLSIYIANVPFIIEELNLWSILTERISTIYLPHRNIPMLPTILTDLCSLQEEQVRVVFGIDIIIDKDIIKSIQFVKASIKVVKNYNYGEEVERNEQYKKILKICQIINKKYNYIEEIKDSHNLIEFLMILMSIESAKKMQIFENGIYRSLIVKNIPDYIPKDIQNLIKIWNNPSCSYNDYNTKKGHNLIGGGVESYIHITSPIRRLIDLLNMMILQKNLDIIKFNESAEIYYKKWMNKLPYINKTMKDIRKVEQDCRILNECNIKPEILNKVYDGYIIEKREKGNYLTYIKILKIIIKVKIEEEIELYCSKKIKVFLIEDGLTFKKKIRGMIVLK